MVSVRDSRLEGREFDPRPRHTAEQPWVSCSHTHMYPCPPSSKVGTSFGWDKCTTGAVLAVGCLQAGPCSWQPTGATPAPLIPV